MASSRLQLLSKKLVKPSSPTPHPLKHYKLSLIDQLAPASYMPIALFYRNHKGHNLSPDTTQTSSILEKSLSKLLSSYYPFAGKLVHNISVDCNDTGAAFLEAKIKCSMSDVLKEPHSCLRDTIFPNGLPWTDPQEGSSLVVAQLNHFDCGGKALSVCLSHKLGDGNTLINFLSDWAATARQPDRGIALASPQFIGSSLYPPVSDPFTKSIYSLGIPSEQVESRRVVFTGSKIKHLKAAVAAESSGSVHSPTKFEVVTAILAKSAVAASRANLSSFNPFVVGFSVNLRQLTTPPLPPSTVGNIVSISGVPILDEAEMKLSSIVSKLRKRKVEMYEKYRGMKEINELVSAALEAKEKMIAANGFDEYKFTSLCNYPLYNVDFGWGRPTKVSFASPQTNNSFILTDNPNGDGVEAIVSLDEQVMSILESDPEIHAFASFDPSIQDQE